MLKKAKLFCVGASKCNPRNPDDDCDDPMGEAIEHANVAYLCCAMDCPKGDLQTQPVEDQFGSRDIKFRTPTTV